MARNGKAKARKRNVKDLSPRSAKGKSVKGGGAKSANNLKQIGIAIHN